MDAKAQRQKIKIRWVLLQEVVRLPLDPCLQAFAEKNLIDLELYAGSEAELLRKAYALDSGDILILLKDDELIDVFYCTDWLNKNGQEMCEEIWKSYLRNKEF